jgi:two-component system, NtrC family, nitrogen regulation response regulator NtrX
VKPILYLGCPALERDETEQLLAEAKIAVVWADTASAALLELQRREMPVLLDLSRGAVALQLAREVRAERAATLMFAVVDPKRPDLTTEAVLAGMADVFARPIGGRRVASAIERELGAGADVKRSLEITSDDLYHQSPAMRDMMPLVIKAATMRAGVLVKGEDGVGRQTVARAIHAAQANGRGAPFVCIDCAAYEGDALEAELFGVPGRPHLSEAAARGLARVSRASRLHDALGGTLYLQNVAEAPARVQARLARILRDREALLVESGAAISLDVRPMAGVDPGFESALHDGRVREDLFRRLSVISIDVPPLRNRREDIPALANYFVREICALLRVPPKTLSRPALSLIAALPWRGNAVELRTLLESVIVDLPGGRGIGLEEVLAHVRLDGGAVVYSSGGTLRQARARFERDYIAAVLEQHHGRMSDAAKALGIQRTNLYRKVRSLRVNRRVPRA